MTESGGHSGWSGSGPGRPLLTRTDAAVMLALSAIMLASFLWSDSTYLLPTAEDLLEMAPYRLMVAEAFRGGFFPLWTPQILCGLPLAAWPHSSAFYPLGFIFGLWDYARALPANLCVHLFIFGLGLTAMLRSLSIRREAALLASVFVTFGPVATYWQLSFLPTIYTGAWVPWLFACAFLLVRSPRLSYVLGLAASFALQVAGGRYDLIGRELIIMGLIGAAVAARKGGRRAMGLWLAAGLAGSLLAAALVLMHYGYFSRSIRSIPFSLHYFRLYQRDLYHVGLFFFWVLTPSVGLGLIGLKRGARGRLLAGAGLVIGVCLVWIAAPEWWLWAAFHVPLLDKLLWPNVSLLLAYMALAVIVGEGIGAWLMRGADAPLLTPALVAAGFAAVFFIMAGPVRGSMSVGNELSSFVSALFNKTVPAAALLVTAAVIAALYYRDRRREAAGATATDGRRRARIMLLCCSCLVGCDVLGGALTGMMRFPAASAPEIQLAAGAAPVHYQPRRSLDLFPWSEWRETSLLAKAAADPSGRTIDGFISMPVREYGEFMSLIAPSALVVKDGKLFSERFMSALKEGDYIRPASIRLLDFLDVGELKAEGTNVKLGPVYHFAWAPESVVSRKGEWEADKRERRWDQTGPGGWEGAFPPVSGFRFQTQIRAEAGGPAMVEIFHDSGHSARDLLYARALPAGSGIHVIDLPLPPPGTGDITLQGAAVPSTAEGCNVSWLDPRLFSRERAFQLQSSAGGVDTLVNPAALPPAFAVHRTDVIPERGPRLAYLLAHGEQLGAEAVLEAAPGGPVRAAGPAGDDVWIENYEAQKISLQVRLGGPGLLVMSDVFYPGWRARDERGREVRVLRADHAFRAIWVDEGDHRIAMKFEPADFRVGLWASLASLGFAVIMLIVAAARRPASAGRVAEVDSRGGP